MVSSWFRTPHPVTATTDISSVAFWSRSFDDREKAFAQLRSDVPVSWNPPLETPGLDRRRREAGFWAVTRAADIAFVSRHPELFSSEIGQVSVRPAPFRLDTNMLVVDPPLHTALRRIVSEAFTARALDRIAESIRRNARQIVLLAAHERQFDVVSSVSAPLPLRTIALLIGVPRAERDRFVTAADAYTRGSIPTHLPAGMTPERWFAEQSAFLKDLCAQLAEWRRREPGDDLMTRLVSATLDGEPLSDEMILSTVFLLIMAGNDTTKQMITLSIIALERFPDQKKWLLKAFDDRFDPAFEELVRYASPVISFARTATQDAELAGVHITAGDKVALFYCSGNRDEQVFGDAGELDLGRNPNTHVAFGGGGVHFCLGSRLAREEVKCLLREIFDVMPDLRLGTPVYKFGESTHAVESLPAFRPL